MWSALLLDCRPVERRRHRGGAKFRPTARACKLARWDYRLVGGGRPGRGREPAVAGRYRHHLAGIADAVRNVLSKATPPMVGAARSATHRAKATWFSVKRRGGIAVLRHRQLRPLLIRDWTPPRWAASKQRSGPAETPTARGRDVRRVHPRCPACRTGLMNTCPPSKPIPESFRLLWACQRSHVVPLSPIRGRADSEATESSFAVCPRT